MKAAVCSTYGSPDVVYVDDVAKPVPRDNDVLIKVRAAGPGSRWLIGLVSRPAEVFTMSRFGSQKLVTFLARPDQRDLIVMSELMAAGKVTPVIDRCHALSDIRPGLQYLREKHAAGKVVIDPEK
jgi:NADPH:quinone reductase-like Zn-dependent oxidoreductase